MKIGFLCFGTRGDIEPICILAKNIFDSNPSNQNCFVFTSSDHQAFVESYLIPVVPLIKSFDSKKWIQCLFSSKTSTKGRAMFSALQYECGMALDKWINSNGLDILIINQMSLLGILVARKWNIPVILCCLCPILPSADFFCLSALENLLPDLPDSTKYINNFDFVWKKLQNKTTMEPLQNLYSHFKKFRNHNSGIDMLEKYLGLEEADWFFEFLDGRYFKVLNLWDHELFRPHDWECSTNMKYLGFLRSTSNNVLPIDKDLIEFCKEPSYYVGFGSMRHPNINQILIWITKSLLEMNQKIIMCIGWSSVNMNDFVNHKNVFICQEVNHDWLFPKLKGVIFHGGSGTLGAVLKYQIPCLIVPFIYDQLLWGNICAQHLEIGPNPISSYCCNEESIRLSINKLVSHHDLFKENAVSYFKKVSNNLCFEILQNTIKELVTEKKISLNKPQINSFLSLSKANCERPDFSVISFYFFLYYTEQTHITEIEYGHLCTLNIFDSKNQSVFERKELIHHFEKKIGLLRDTEVISNNTIE